MITIILEREDNLCTFLLSALILDDKKQEYENLKIKDLEKKVNDQIVDNYNFKEREKELKNYV